MELKRLLREMLEHEASDLYLKEGSPPSMRVNGEIQPLGEKALTQEAVAAISKEILTEDERAQFLRDREFDFPYEVPAVGRFRVNAFFQRHTVGFVFRAIRQAPDSFEALNLPPQVMESLAHAPRGLILVTGAAGSGKSTTLAALVEQINQKFPKHIITIEDPIEFTYEEKQSIITQRQVGTDTVGFHVALRHVFRQSPDVILIGEMRDLDTITASLQAAETGHLVLSTLHTINAVQTVQRILSFFEPHVHQQIRMQLALVLKGIVSLRLLPRADEPGRVPAYEILLDAPTVKKFILEGRIPELAEVIHDGTSFGMLSFNQCLINLYRKGWVSEEMALKHSDSPEDLSLALREIYLGKETHRIQG